MTNYILTIIVLAIIAIGEFAIICFLRFCLERFSEDSEKLLKSTMLRNEENPVGLNLADQNLTLVSEWCTRTILEIKSLKNALNEKNETIKKLKNNMESLIVENENLKRN